MMAEYDQHAYQKHAHNGFHQYDQRGYQNYDQRGFQKQDQRAYQQYDQRGQQQLQQLQQQQQQQQQYDQQQYDHSDIQQSQTRSTILERGRAIRLMRNGDPFFTGRNFVINQKKYPMLDVFLDDASRSLRANFGAVRCVYTPRHGTRVQDISDFEDHCTYVAAGGEKFKKLHYLDIAEGKRVPNKGQLSPKTHLPPIRRNDVEGRALKLSRSENVIIYVYRNGDPLTLPAKVLLVKSTLQNWECVLDEITKKVSLTNTAVLKLYAMNGELITSARQLEYSGMYVAAGKERFRRIDYPDPQWVSPNSSPKMSRKSYTKSDGVTTYTNTANSHGSTDNPAQRRTGREENDYFNNKPQQHRRGPTKETDLDRDDGGIYKGRLNHRERAREIDETNDTKVDMPVGYREVETVEEENLYNNAGKKLDRHNHTQSHHQFHPDSRQQPLRIQRKTYDEDYNDDYRYPLSNSRDNAYDNNYPHHAETPIDDDQIEQQLPHSSYRQPAISPSTQTQYYEEQQMIQDMNSNIDENHQSSQVTEDHYGNVRDKA